MRIVSLKASVVFFSLNPPVLTMDKWAFFFLGPTATGLGHTQVIHDEEIKTRAKIMALFPSLVFVTNAFE